MRSALRAPVGVQDMPPVGVGFATKPLQEVSLRRNVRLSRRPFFLCYTGRPHPRQILTLPGTRTVDGHQEFIRFASPPNKQIRPALEAACKRVTDLKLQRDGLVLRLAVAPMKKVARTRRSKAVS
jgi:hypothetical protein